MIREMLLVNSKSSLKTKDLRAFHKVWVTRRLIDIIELMKGSFRSHVRMVIHPQEIGLNDVYARLNKWG